MLCDELSGYDKVFQSKIYGAMLSIISVSAPLIHKTTFFKESLSAAAQEI